jgi:2,3-bisphosphoglycerate-dependent phosphoglycerate mutase
VDLLLVRHGVTQYNTDRIFMGHDPVPLSGVGQDQVERLADRLSVDPPTRIISSDILRARQSAEIIAAKLGLPFQTYAGLREVDVGFAKGVSYAEAAERWPKIFAPEGEERFPEGESFAEVADRAADFLRSVILGEPGRILAVTHGGVVRGVAARLLRLPLACVAGFVIDNASLTVFRAEINLVQLVTWNDTAHLGPARAGGGWSGAGG